jgi:hypothetical protein
MMHQNAGLVAAEPAMAYRPAADPYDQVRSGRML